MTPPVDYETSLDPEVAAHLAESPLGALDFADLDLATVLVLREMMPLTFTAPPSDVEHRDEELEAADGESFAVRVYRPNRPGTGRACIVWIHGGGFMLGSPLADEAQLDRWVEALDCVAISVDYRLAPEHPYPVPLEDCYAALAWTIGNAEKLGVDPARIVVAGASAGGGLAAGLALLARDRQEFSLRAQLLIYPMLDDRNATASSEIASPIWPKSANQLGWQSYLGAAGEDVPGYAAPARAEDLSGLPETYVAVGTVDILRDEAIDYARRLLTAGVSTELHVYPGVPHAVDILAPEATMSRRLHRDALEALRRALR